ncbi:hypothetical protein SKAU_G00304590 [Synaphobranchus kaupii]|uniref:Uncharacterized protein n=1 Tax=Synaphobranchus kaupii TaxID=118154 RepID=A0A9Q1EWB9_SYNKA|nr:hypothetical protein SKAU_G00304590 [Synaphobranchus kaupii]
MTGEDSGMCRTVSADLEKGQPSVGPGVPGWGLGCSRESCCQCRQASPASSWDSGVPQKLRNRLKFWIFI